jgi:excisionase family DNA binding protein
MAVPCGILARQSNDFSGTWGANMPRESILIDPVHIAKPRDLTPLAVGLRDAARLLGVSESWLGQRAKAGEIPSVLVGGRRLFVVESLRQWLAGQDGGIP